MEINTNIGAVIRRLRREKNLTQKTLAKELNISVAYINLIENNRRSITVPLLLKIASLFNIEFLIYYNRIITILQNLKK